MQAIGLQLGVVQVAGKRVGSVLQLRLRALQHLDGGGELRVERGHGVERVHRAAGECVGVVVGLGHRVERAARRFDQRLRVREPLVLGLEFGPFAVGRGELVELADLPGQTLAFAVEIGLLRARSVEGLRGLLPVGPTRTERAGVEAGMGVEQGANGRAARQALPGVLTMDIDEVVGRFTHLCQRGGAAVHPCAALALRVDRAAQQQRVGRREAGVGEPVVQAGRRVELGADLGPQRAFAHHAGVAAAAERELQRVDQDGLAGTGFTGEHREAARQLDIERADDDEVAQRQAQPHAQPPAAAAPAPEFQWSLRRSVA